MPFGNQTDVQLRPELSANRTPIDFGVEQNAVAHLSDAFRQGLINADDIISRYGTLAKTKERAQIQGLEEFISPEAIQARQDAIAAEGGKARLEGARAKAEIPLVGTESGAKQAQLEALRVQAELSPNRYDLKRDYALQNGFDVPDVPEGGATPEWNKKVNEVFKRAYRFKLNRDNAQAMLSNIESKPAEITTIEGGNRVTRIDPKKVTHIDKRTGAIIDDKTYQRLVGLSYSLPTDHEDNPVTMVDALMGSKPGTVVEPKAAPAEPAKPVVEPEGILVKSEPAKEAILTPADKERALGQVRVVDEMAKKINDAQAIVHNAAINPVGPGIVQGTQIGQTLAKVGAAFGNETAVKKAEAQNQLDQFIAQSIQNTIRSMAGSGNRVMQAEIDPHTGLFTRANPSMSSTPATWDKWFGEMRDLFSRARNDAVGMLSEEDRAAIPAEPAAVIPGGSTTPGQPATFPNAITTTLKSGKKLIYDGKNFHYSQ